MNYWVKNCPKNNFVSFVKRHTGHDLFRYQRIFFYEIENNQHIIGKKSRNVGFSEFAIWYSFWKCSNLDNQHIFIGHPNQVICDYCQPRPDFIKQFNVKVRDHDIVFPQTNSHIYIVPLDVNFARGRRLNYLILDESAFVRNMETIWGVCYAALSSGGKTICVSTSSFGSWFNDKYEESTNCINGFHVADFIQ